MYVVSDVWHTSCIVISHAMCVGMILACMREHNVNSTLGPFRASLAGVGTFGPVGYGKDCFASFTVCSVSWHGPCFDMMCANLTGMVLATCMRVFRSHRGAWVTICALVIIRYV
jgi:hypothetical protein